MNEFFYVARSPRALKIGHTVSATTRVLQLVCPLSSGKVRLLQSFAVPYPGARIFERNARLALGEGHRLKFRHELGRNYEWFRWHPSLVPTILSVVQEGIVMPSSSSIGKELRAKRIERGLTQVETARAIGISQAMLAHLETGIRSPSPEIQAKISRWFSKGSAKPRAVRGPYNIKRDTLPVKS